MRADPTPRSLHRRPHRRLRIAHCRQTKQLVRLWELSAREPSLLRGSSCLALPRRQRREMAQGFSLVPEKLGGLTTPPSLLSHCAFVGHILLCLSCWSRGANTTVDWPCHLPLFISWAALQAVQFPLFSLPAERLPATRSAAVTSFTRGHSTTPGIPPEWSSYGAFRGMKRIQRGGRPTGEDYTPEA